MSLFLTTSSSTADATALIASIKAFFADFAMKNLLSAVIVAVICLVVVKILLKILDRVLVRAEQMDGTIKSLVRVILKAVFLFVSIIIVLTTLGISVTSLVAVLSVCGLAVSLAVQNFLSNVAGGLQLAASKPFKEGDFVEAGGTSGVVHEIGLFYTKLSSPDNKLVQIPNSAIVSSNIINYSSEDKRRVDLTISTSYDAPIEQVKEVLSRLAGEHALTLATPVPQISIMEYGDSAIKYTVRVWCANEDYWTVYFDLMDAIKPAFDAAGIEMTYPHVNVHMIKS